MFEEQNSLVEAEPAVESNPYKILLRNKRGRSFSEPPSSISPEISPRSLRELVDTGFLPKKQVMFPPHKADAVKVVIDDSKEEPTETSPKIS